MNPVDLFPDMGRILKAGVRSPVQAPERIRQRHDMGVGRGPLPAFSVKLVGADIDTRPGIAVIPHFHGDHVPLSCDRFCHAQRQLVGFAAGIHKMHHGQIIGKRGQQGFGKPVDAVMQVPGIGIENGHLGLAGFYHPGVFMTHMGHVVHGIQKRSPGLI